MNIIVEETIGLMDICIRFLKGRLIRIFCQIISSLVIQVRISYWGLMCRRIGGFRSLC